MPALTNKVRLLRRNQTKAEAIFWEAVRNHKTGFKFKRQYPIKFRFYGISRTFIADFYCASLKLIIEIDGGIHLANKEYDDLRDNILTQLGFRVVRFLNEEIYSNLGNVLDRIGHFTRSTAIAPDSTSASPPCLEYKTGALSILTDGEGVLLRKDGFPSPCETQWSMERADVRLRRAIG